MCSSELVGDGDSGRRKELASVESLVVGVSSLNPGPLRWSVHIPSTAGVGERGPSPGGGDANSGIRDGLGQWGAGRNLGGKVVGGESSVETAQGGAGFCSLLQRKVPTQAWNVCAANPRVSQVQLPYSASLPTGRTRAQGREGRSWCPWGAGECSLLCTPHPSPHLCPHPCPLPLPSP